MNQNSYALVLVLATAVVACTSSNDDPPPPAPTYSVGGAVSGLTAPGLVLQLNGGGDITVDIDGSFTFPSKLGNGAAYDVTVATVPAGLTCTVSAGDGVISGANVSNVVVTCALSSHTVGGVVSGIVDGELTLHLNGGDEIMLTADGPFTFPTPLANDSPYEVTIFGEPNSTNCTITNQSGTISGADVTDVEVNCVRTYAVGGRVFGATVAFIIQLNGGEELVLSPGASGPFTFNTRLASGEAYVVTVSTPPTGQECDVRDGTGTISDADVTGIEIYCAGAAGGLHSANRGASAIYLKVNINNGATQAISRNIDFDNIAGLAYNQSTSILYGADEGDDSLVAINSATGAAARIGANGALGFTNVNGLAYDDVGGVLYGIVSVPASTMARLITIDTATGVGTAVGANFSIGSGQCLGLAYDGTSDMLIASTDDGNLFTVDPATGIPAGSQSIGSTDAIDGLGIDQATNVLYAVLNGTTLVTIDLGTGTPTVVGTVDGYDTIRGLTYASDFDDVFVTDTAPTAVSVLLTVDPTDASARTIGSMGWAIAGMAQDPVSKVAYGITVDSHLLEIDQDTGETRYIDQVVIPNGGETKCLAYDTVRRTLFTFGIDPTGDDTLYELGVDGSVITDHGVVAADGGDWEAMCYAIHGSSRDMFGVHNPGSGQDTKLYRVSQNGVATLMFELSGLVEVQAIAFEHNGTASRFYAVDTSNNRLMDVRQLTGDITVVGFTDKAFGLIYVP